MTTKDHPISLFPEVYERWTGPDASRMGVNNPDGLTTRWEWDIDLTAQESTLFDDTVRAAGAKLTVSDWLAIKAESGRLRTYLQTASPTNAQSVQAIKDIIRVLYKTIGQNESQE